MNFPESPLGDIAKGGRIEIEDVGDITDQERRKGGYYIAVAQARIEQLEYQSANDNEVPLDEELTDLIRSDW